MEVGVFSKVSNLKHKENPSYGKYTLVEFFSCHTRASYTFVYVLVLLTQQREAGIHRQSLELGG
jgi:hypothetical protein